MNRKVLVIAVALMAVAMLAIPMVSAVPWTYPKNNEKFEKFETTIAFEWTNLIMANYAATAGLGAGDANKIVVTYDEQPIPGYQIRIGEGAGQRVYNLYDPNTGTGDFVYVGVATMVTFDPILPYAFDPNNPIGTLFVPGAMHHFRVDYMYDFSAVLGGLEGTITMLALVTGNGVFLTESAKAMLITSVEGTGDFRNVQIQATGITEGHLGVVLGWPE